MKLLNRFSFGLCFFCVSNGALASEVRVRSLSAPAGIDDETKVFSYPSLVTKYSLALAEFGNAADQEAYALVISKLSNVSLGVAISRDTSVYSYTNAASGWNDENDFIRYNFGRYNLNRRYAASLAAQPRRPIDLFMGWALEGNRSFGLRLTLAGDVRQTKNETQTASANAEQFDIRAGYTTPALNGVVDVSLRLGLLGKQEVKVDPAVGDTSSEVFERGVAFDALGRWVSSSPEKAKPFVKAGLSYATPKSKALGTKSKTREGSEILFDAQGGYQYKPVESVLISGHMGGFYMKSEGHFALSSAATPVAGNAAATALDFDSVQNSNYRVAAADTDQTAKVTGYGAALGAGAEGLLSDNWGLLVGANYLLWGRVKTQDGNGAGKPTYTSNLPETSDSGLWSLGLFYQRQSLRIDGSVSIKRMVHNGPYFISGTATAPLVAQFAAGYTF